MTQPIRNRSRLMLGCGSATLALALALAPHKASAQGIQANGDVVFGVAEIYDVSVTETNVDVFTPTVVIDWTPNEDAGGNALDFIRTGATANFNGGLLADFSVLNRILPATNGNIAVIDGTVLSRITDPVSGGLIPSGFVAFYSPTGILIGSNATFDVGSLMLTTLDVSNTDFQNFAEFGFGMTMAAVPGATARIQISPGAQITATPENSFFAVVAADVQMLGTAKINGSHAYVAGEVVNLSFSNGLFDISVPVGTAASGTVMELNGDIGGPSSTGVGDNHMIYGVAAAQVDPISMIFRGNLGFDPAVSAGVVNGEIILSANHDVFGRFVDGGAIDQGINAQFGANSATSTVRADIFMEDFSATSSVLAISTHRTRVSALNNNSSVQGNLLIVGRENAELTAEDNYDFNISGDVLVSASDYGVASYSLPSLDQINAAGGSALISSIDNSTIRIGGNAVVSADAFGGVDYVDLIAGSAQGGQAIITGSPGTINIGGNATVTARGLGPAFTNIETGATARGGLVQFSSGSGGDVTLGGSLVLDASATGAQGDTFGPSTVSDAFGGNALLNILGGGGSITIGGDVTIGASATGGSSNNAGAGSIGDGGVAIADIAGPGNISIAGSLVITSDGVGGFNAGGTGGAGLGGQALAATSGDATIDVGTDFSAYARGTGGDGQTGGDGLGGIAGANAIVGTISIGGSGLANAGGIGGSASFGFGGNGGLGRGGNAFFQADGTLTEVALISIASDATVIADGEGGFGGQTDGSLIAAGRGGDGYGGQSTVANQADSDFVSGAYLLAGSDNGTLDIGGTAVVESSGFGGLGGSGSSFLPGGLGGDAFGGLAQAGLALLGGDGSVGQGSANFASLLVDASAYAGSGGFFFGELLTGPGGNATGGNAFLTIRAGTVTADSISLNADGFGGDGINAGFGTGGNAAAFGSLSGKLTTGLLSAIADGFGGFSGFDNFRPGVSGDGQGGLAEFDFTDITVQVNGDVYVSAEGFGGGTGEFTAANGTGGTARLGVLGALAGSGTITGNTVVSASGFGGYVINGLGQAGDGSGGTATILAGSGGTVSLQTVQVMANGFGGQSEVPGYEGGNGFGGFADISATDSGSQITIARNVTNSLADDFNFGAILSANGVGGAGTGGSGVGGNGTGGTALVSASQGGSLALPADPFNDPDSVGVIRLFARGFGGNSFVDGGIGGNSFGGAANVEVDGGLLTMGETVLSSFAQGGTAENGALNVTGGNAYGGDRSIRVINGGTLTMALIGDGPGAQGGNGTGTGNGGNAFAGSDLFEVIGSTINLVGNFSILNASQGGNGATGGNADGGSTTVNISNATISGGRLEVNSLAVGGTSASASVGGGSAIGGSVTASITGSQLNLVGETLFAADARGGASGLGGNGGTADSGTVEVTITDSVLTIAANANPGLLRVRSRADGGQGGSAGVATSSRATLTLSGTTLNADQVFVEARAFSFAPDPGTGAAFALAGEASFNIAGNTGITADLIEISTNAQMAGVAGAAYAGQSSLSIAPGSTASVNAGTINVLADASGAEPSLLANYAGQFVIDIAGGNVNAGVLLASSIGDRENPEVGRSWLTADSGNLNAASTLTARTIGDMLISSSGGGIIGSPATTGTLTAIDIDATGTIEVVGDGSTGGVGGRTIDMLAGRSILIGGTLTTSNGNITLTANHGNAPVVSQPPVSVFTMAQGTRIDAGTGTVSISLLDGAGDPQRVNGAITLASITAGQIDARNFGTSPGSDITVLADGVLTASGTGRAIDLASLNGEVINLAGDAGLVLTGGGHFGIFAATPTGSQIGSFANYARRYNVLTETAYDALNPGGNFAAFRISPVLTVTVNDAVRVYGNANPQFTVRIDGFLAGDGITDLTGTPDFTTAATLTSGIGSYTIIAALGTLLSAQGYSFTFAPGTLTITPRPLTLIANSVSRLVGLPDPEFTFRIAEGNLVNGDQLTGTLTRDPGEAIGSYAIRQGTLTAGENYAIDFVNGQLTIDPPPAPDVLANPTLFDELLRTGADPSLVSPEEVRFGIDFPEQPDAPLISEEPLLDDPVTSGGDASLYSGGGAGKRGSEDE